jgi:hypothetical protein
MKGAWSFRLRAQPGGSAGWQWVRRNPASGSMLASFQRFPDLMDCFDDASRHGFGGWARSIWLSNRPRVSADAAVNPAQTSSANSAQSMPRPVRGR